MAPPGPTQTPPVLRDATGTRPITEPTGHIVQSGPYPTGMAWSSVVVVRGGVACGVACGLWGPLGTQPAGEGLRRWELQSTRECSIEMWKGDRVGGRCRPGVMVWRPGVMFFRSVAWKRWSSPILVFPVGVISA